MLRALTWMIVGTLVLSSLLTPLVFAALAQVFGNEPWPFSRVFDRVAMLFLALFVIIFRRDFPLAGVKDLLVPLEPRRDGLMTLTGILLAVCTSLALLPLLVAEGELVWNRVSGAEVAWRCARLIPAALLISLLEESFFRVLLLKRFALGLPVWLAVAASSLLYALAHFVTPAKAWVYPGYSALIGFDYLAAVVERLNLPGVAPAFFGMFLVGVVLCTVILSTRSLLLCIGLHSGWVVAIRLARFLTDEQYGHASLAGAGRRYFLVTQPLTWAAILLVGILVLTASRLIPAMTRGKRDEPVEEAGHRADDHSDPEEPR